MPRRSSIASAAAIALLAAIAGLPDTAVVVASTAGPTLSPTTNRWIEFEGPIGQGTLPTPLVKGTSFQLLWWSSDFCTPVFRSACENTGPPAGFPPSTCETPCDDHPAPAGFIGKVKITLNKCIDLSTLAPRRLISD